MKKSILNLGKSLEKNQQKRINGGLTELRHQDENCDGLGELDYDPSCGCWTDSQCHNMGYILPDGTHTLRSGTCTGGVCVSA